jgi:hypothetical protein
MRYRIRYQNHDFELPVGVFVIGRAMDCQMSLDDPLVSRRHAYVRVSANEATIEDAGSRNGVILNGQNIDKASALKDGDRITIGGQSMEVVATDEPARSSRPQSPTMATLAVSRTPDKESARSTWADSFRLLSGVAEKAMALNNHETAERLLQNSFTELRNELHAGKEVQSEPVDQAMRFAARLALATAKGSYLDLIVDIHMLRGVPPSQAVIDELYNAARKVKGFDLTSFRALIENLQKRINNLTPNERFLLQRLDGLERILAAR